MVSALKGTQFTILFNIQYLGLRAEFRFCSIPGHCFSSSILFNFFNPAR